MVNPIGSGDSALLVMLLLVIVERFSTLARTATEQKSSFLGTPPIFVPTDTEQRSTYQNGPPSLWFTSSESSDSTEDGYGISSLGQVLPKLGRLNHIHTTNMAVLTTAFLIVAATEPGLIKNALGFVVVLIWLQLPMLEIKNYGEHRKDRSYPVELYAHLLGTLLIVWYVMGSNVYEPGLFLRTPGSFSDPLQTFVKNPDQLLGVFGLAALVLGTTGAFLFLFECEISEEE